MHYAMECIIVFEERLGGNGIIMWGRQVVYKKEKVEWDVG